MKKNKFYNNFILKSGILLLICLQLFSCKTTYLPKRIEARNQKVVAQNATDTAFSQTSKILNPYKDSLDKIMHIIIGEAAETFIKEKNGTSLGYLVTDAMLENAMVYIKDQQIDINQKNIICITNLGGIRLPALEKGKISIEKIFELLPFENTLTIISCDKKTIQDFLRIANKNGNWPISFIKNPIETDEIILITNDYLASGGDNCSMLKELKKTQTTILMRDALIDYLKKYSPISPVKSQRIF